MQRRRKARARGDVGVFRAPARAVSALAGAGRWGAEHERGGDPLPPQVLGNELGSAVTARRKWTVMVASVGSSARLRVAQEIEPFIPWRMRERAAKAKKRKVRSRVSGRGRATTFHHAVSMQSSTLRGAGRGRRSRMRAAFGLEGSPDRRADCDPRRGIALVPDAVLSVQIVQGPGRIGNDERSETHRHLNPLGWGPKGRWLKSVAPTTPPLRQRTRQRPCPPRQVSRLSGVLLCMESGGFTLMPLLAQRSSAMPAIRTRRVYPATLWNAFSARARALENAVAATGRERLETRISLGFAIPPRGRRYAPRASDVNAAARTPDVQPARISTPSSPSASRIACGAADSAARGRRTAPASRRPVSTRRPRKRPPGARRSHRVHQRARAIAGPPPPRRGGSSRQCL